MRTAIKRRASQLVLATTALLGALGCIVGASTGPGSGDTFRQPGSNVAVITLSPKAISGQAGKSVQIAAAAQTQSGQPVSSQAVAWESSNTVAATVSGTGKVSLLHAGRSTITAIANGVTASLAAVVDAPPPASVSVTPGNTEIKAGETVQLVATPLQSSGSVDSGVTVTWSSSNSGVASVSGSGLVTAIAAGAATITASASGISGKATIKVTSTTPVVASVSVSPGSSTLYPVRTEQLTATLKDASGTVVSGQPVSWSTSNSGVAAISSSGNVTGGSVGTATITASANGHSGTATVTVSNPVVASVTVSPSSLTLGTSENSQLTATPRDANGVAVNVSVSWASTDPTTASVSASGLVTGNAPGSATVSATAGGFSGSSAVTVQAGGPYHEPSGMVTQINTGPINSTSAVTVFSPSSPNAQAEWSGNISVVPGGTGLRISYPTNLPGGYSPVRFGHSIPSAGTGWYYQRVKVRFSSNWTMSSNVGVKFCEPRTQQQGSGQGPNENHVIGAYDFETQSTHAFLTTVLQGPNGHFQDLYEQPRYSAASDLNTGGWHLVEVVFTPESTPGAGDGTYTGWVDGVQISHYSGVQWLAAGNQVGWPYLMFDPTYGGGTNSPVAPMYWDFDELYVSTR